MAGEEFDSNAVTWRAEVQHVMSPELLALIYGPPHECIGTDGNVVLCINGWVHRVCRHPKCDGVPHVERLCLCACHGLIDPR